MRRATPPLSRRPFGAAPLALPADVCVERRYTHGHEVEDIPTATFAPSVPKGRSSTTWSSTGANHAHAELHVTRARPDGTARAVVFAMPDTAALRGAGRHARHPGRRARRRRGPRGAA
jgi:hypothetical protein